MLTNFINNYQYPDLSKRDPPPIKFSRKELFPESEVVKKEVVPDTNQEPKMEVPVEKACEEASVYISSYTSRIAFYQSALGIDNAQLKIPSSRRKRKHSGAEIAKKTISEDDHVQRTENLDHGAGRLSFEKRLFDLLKNLDTGTVCVTKFLQSLYATGLRKKDPRLKKCIAKIQELRKEQGGSDGEESNLSGLQLNEGEFIAVIDDSIDIIGQAFKNEFVVPEFKIFCDAMDEIYEDCKQYTSGKVADYIPQLARFSPDYWGLSFCTVDGQRHSIGDCKVPFCLQSASKPLNYAIAQHDRDADNVHRHVGQEPSGRSFNELSLNPQNRPHNPMINAGAICVASLLKTDLCMADRFDYVSNEYKRLAGKEFVGYSNATFLSERETADRNFALAYYMQENKVFPTNAKLQDTLDLYFQLCSIEVNAESGSVIAATLANGGICPLTGEKVLDPQAVRNTLSLMHSCGMYDYSGQFAFKVGLPAKSGVSGVILLVIPNVMGLCCWSPPLDECGNSERGIKFCEKLVNTFNFHNYDNLKHTAKKMDPRRRELDNQANQVVNLLFGAAHGDVSAIRRFAVQGIDMGQADYDGRTALHLAAAEGRLEVVKYLLEKCTIKNTSPKDRWGFTPLDDARKFKHQNIVEYLEARSK